MAQELSPDDPDAVTVIATGGLASLVINEVPVIDAHEPWLTLIGLRLVFERNTSSPAADAVWRREMPDSRLGAGSLSGRRGKRCRRAAPPVAFGRDREQTDGVPEQVRVRLEKRPGCSPTASTLTRWASRGPTTIAEMRGAIRRRCRRIPPPATRVGRRRPGHAVPDRRQALLRDASATAPATSR